MISLTVQEFKKEKAWVQCKDINLSAKLVPKKLKRSIFLTNHQKRYIKFNKVKN